MLTLELIFSHFDLHENTGAARSSRCLWGSWPPDMKRLDLIDTKLLCEFKLIYKDNFHYTSRALWATSIVLNCLAVGVSGKRTRYGKWDNDLSTMIITKDNNFPSVHVI